MSADDPKSSSKLPQPDLHPAKQVRIKFSWELAWPFVVSAALTGCTVLLRQHAKLTIATELASPSLSIMAIIVGFLAAIVTFIFTAQNVPALERLKTIRGQFGRLIEYHWSAIGWGFVACIGSMVMQVAAKMLQLGQPYHPRHWTYFLVLFDIWCFLGLFALCLFVRVAWLSKLLLTPVDED